MAQFFNKKKPSNKIYPSHNFSSSKKGKLNEVVVKPTFRKVENSEKSIFDGIEQGHPIKMTGISTRRVRLAKQKGIKNFNTKLGPKNKGQGDED
jgi:hypothetical protein